MLPLHLGEKSTDSLCFWFTDVSCFRSPIPDLSPLALQYTPTKFHLYCLMAFSAQVTVLMSWGIKLPWEQSPTSGSQCVSTRGSLPPKWIILRCVPSLAPINLSNEISLHFPVPLVGYLLVFVSPPQSSISLSHFPDKSFSPDSLTQSPNLKTFDYENCSLDPGVPYLVETMQEITTHPKETLNLAFEAVTGWGIVGTLELSPSKEGWVFLLEGE